MTICLGRDKFIHVLGCFFFLVVIVVVVVVVVIVVVVLHHSKGLLQKNKDFSQHTYHNPRQGITNQ